MGDMALWSIGRVLIVSFLYVGAGLAQHGVSFLFPTAGLTLNYFDTVNVSYTSSFPSPLLYTFCTSSTDGTIITEHSQSVSANNASALVLLNYNNGSPCWFDLRPNTSAGYGANSPSFTLNPTQVSFPKTVGLSQPSSASSTTSFIASPTTLTSATTSATAAPAITSTAGLSDGAKAGIGVGIALGFILVGTISGLVFYRRRRRRSNGKTQPLMYAGYPQEAHGSEYKHNMVAVHELPAVLDSQEMATGWNAHEIGPGR